jgi:hypothetical protein
VLHAQTAMRVMHHGEWAFPTTTGKVQVIKRSSLEDKWSGNNPHFYPIRPVWKQAEPSLRKATFLVPDSRGQITYTCQVRKFLTLFRTSIMY